MTANTKRIILIIALVMTVAAVIFLTRYLTGRPPETTPPDSNVSQTDGVLPSAETGDGNNIIDGEANDALPNSDSLVDGATEPSVGEGGETPYSPTDRDNKITGIMVNQAYSPVAATGGGIKYLDKYDNKFYRLDDNGNRAALSDKVFAGANEVVWSPSQDKAIMTFPDDKTIVYDFNSQRQTTLPDNWQETHFSPSGNELVFKAMGQSADDNWVGVANADGTGAKAVEKIGRNADKVIVSWSPNNQTIAMMPDSLDGQTQNILFVGRNKENFPALRVNGRGFAPLWAPDGNKLVYSVYDSGAGIKPHLYIALSSGDNIGTGQLNLNLETWSHKCVFADTDTVYCAVPRLLPNGSGMFPSLAADASDDLYAIDIKTGAKSQINTHGDFNMQNLVYSKAGGSLYFLDEHEGLMHKIIIPD